VSNVVLLIGPAAGLVAAEQLCLRLACAVERVETGPAALARLCRRDAEVPLALITLCALPGIGVAGLVRGLAALPGRSAIPVWVADGQGPQGTRPLPSAPTLSDLRTLAAAPAAGHPAQEWPLLDPDLMATLRSYGADEFSNFMQLFLNDWEGRLSQIAAQLAQSDRDGLGRTLHGWKGSSGSLGAVRLHHLLATCDRLCKQDDLAGIRALHAELVTTATATASAVGQEKARV
jgi:HPt (histidine-containing phosphotransfer) domain-containing protein